MATLKYWLWLLTRKGLRHDQIRALVEHFGSPEAVYDADDEAYRQLKELQHAEIKKLCDKSLSRPNRILDDCNRLGIWLMTYQDADYPARLKHIYDPPLVLYGKGRRAQWDEEAAIAIVGARECSGYGRKVADILGAQLARQGMLVVSGLARGIDTIAIEGALRTSAPVVGVLGCGIDVVYPRENKKVYEQVARMGTLLSEYPPGTSPYKTNFPMRNRIISGLSVGVVVVEGTERSGALITARYAMEEGRDVFAVPGNIDSSLSNGPNRLLRDGAIPVLSPEDVMGEYVHLYPDKIQLPMPEDTKAEGEPARQRLSEMPSTQKEVIPEVDKSAEKAYIDLNDVGAAYSEEERQILLSLKDQPLQLEDIIEKTQILAGSVLSSLTVLELQGVVRQLPGKYFQLNGNLKE